MEDSKPSNQSDQQDKGDPNDPVDYAKKDSVEGDKMKLLRSESKLTDKFPSTSGRRFNQNWLQNRLWLHYSIKNDSAYCVSSLCFQGTSESPFVSTSFKNSKKVVGKKSRYLDQPMKSKQHQMAVEMGSSFSKAKQAGVDIAAKLNKQVAEQQVYNIKGILLIINVFMPLGQGGIALRVIGTKLKEKRIVILCSF